MAGVLRQCHPVDLQRNTDKGEVGGSSPPRPTIQIPMSQAAHTYVSGRSDEKPLPEEGRAMLETLRFYESLLRTILGRRENPKNHQRTLRPLYRLNFSSQVITGISSDKAWAMI